MGIPAPLVIAAVAFVVSACASTPEFDVMIQEAPKGAVYLERIPDRSFQAAHPIKLDQELIARVLRGVVVKDEKSTLQVTFSHSSKIVGVQAFSDDDIAFLAPLIAQALTQAAPDQQVGFRVLNIAPASYSQREGAAVGSSEPPLQLHPQETTSGKVLAHGRSLHLTLTQYRHRPQQADTIGLANRRLPDPSGLNQREVTFVPEAARRPDTSGQWMILGSPPEATFVIDYELLAKLPESETPHLPTAIQVESPPATPSSAPVKTSDQTGTSDRELQRIKEDMNKKNVEIEALQKEMESIRRELGTRSGEQDIPGSKTKPVQKTQPPTQ